MGLSPSDRAGRTRWPRRRRWRPTRILARAPSRRNRWRLRARFASIPINRSWSKNCREMAIFLPEATQTASESLTPKQIVAELDKYVVGQAAAKRAVAIALRNRMRRQKLPPELA